MKQSSQNIGGEKTKGSPNTPKDYLAMLKSSVLDQAKDYPDPVAVINLVQNNDIIPLLTLKSYSLWQGKQKSKKTTVLAMAMAAYISPYTSKNAIRFERSQEAGKVLFIDTEQGQSFAARTMKMILQIAGVERSDNIIYCDFREFSTGDRIKMIHAGLANIEGIKIIVVDGVVDVMGDFQDAKEGHIVITDLLNICSKYNVHVAGVLHQNKTDDNARSYVGLISSQKCEMEIACKKDSQNNLQSIVECKESRNWHFEPFAIRRERDHLPYIVQDYKPKETKAPGEKNEKIVFDVDSLSLPEHKILLQAIFKGNSEYNDGMLKDQIKLRLKEKGKITEPIARQFVAYWQAHKLIEDRRGPRNAKLFKLSVSERDGP